jgi:sphinganine C4-monooxygenase
MTPRQAIIFFTFSTIKTVDDHCGYALPWDPLQHITGNNAAYHDIHHQSWGIKTNFSQPFFTIWDGWMGTMWKGGDVKLRYDKAKKSAEEWWEDQRKFAQEQLEKKKQKQNGSARNGSSIAPTPVFQKDDDIVSAAVRRSPRKTTTSSSGTSGNLKGLKDRVSGSLPNGVPRVESRQ